MSETTPPKPEMPDSDFDPSLILDEPQKKEMDMSRFQVSSRTLWMDRIMGWIVNVGGIAIIAAVFGILIYLVGVVGPLFKGAEVETLGEPIPLAKQLGAPPTIGTSEDGETVFIYSGEQEIGWVLTKAVGTAAQRATVEKTSLNLPANAPVTAWRWRPYQQQLGVALADGKYCLVKLSYDAKGVLLAKTSDPRVLTGEGTIKYLGFAQGAGEELVAGVVDVNGVPTVKLISLKEKKGLVGQGTVSVDLEQDLAAELHGKKPTRVLVSQSMREILVPLETGEVVLFGRTGSQFIMRQTFAPFQAEEGKLASLEFLFGDVSVVATSEKGKQKIFSLMVPEGSKQREFHQTKELPTLPGAPTAYAISVRNKSFITASSHDVSLRHGTTESIRWEEKLEFPVVAAAITGKNDRIFLLDNQGGLHGLTMHDHYPESGMKAFFGKVWYEGQSAPSYTWQSSSGNDDYEPKYSMVPLIFGTFKATLYSMLISVPIALLAAIYASQFLSAGARRVIKPAMEIMASLPSVVLGFLAAFWLAPLVQYSFPNLLSAMVFTPLAVILASHAWNSLPTRTRNRLPKGMEYLFLVPVVMLAAMVGWKFGGPVESLLFRVANPMGEGTIPDFTLWWAQKKTLLGLAPLLMILIGFPLVFFFVGGKAVKLEPYIGKFAIPLMVIIAIAVVYVSGQAAKWEPHVGKFTIPVVGIIMTVAAYTTGLARKLAPCFAKCTIPIIGLVSLAVAYWVGFGLDCAFPENFVTDQYEQRNATVVGFMMGFAVIPVIFTIAEDALSNVPGHLSAAGFAMGASRWQVMRMVVLPTAAAGIFSALMIGFGRAVGETMVVVMAAGNTPIMEWNPFNGMRPLSANLAVELPEAAQGSTHFRALHLGALILFILTFVVNTIAEIVRNHLRNKFKTL